MSQSRASRATTGPQVLVVEMHETLAEDADRFRRQLEWVAQHFTLISAEDFFALWDKTQSRPNLSKPAVLFTFDDGRKSNYAVAAPLLESLGTRGLFFVVPDFIGLEGQAAREFYYSKIDIRGLPPSTEQEIWTPMSPDHLADLAQRGHSIGSHTLSHTSLVGLPAADLHAQIVTSAERITSWTRSSADAFAWPYAWNAITPEAWDLIKRTYRFCFSPCPGNTRADTDSPHLIWRTEIESYYSESEYRFMYSGWAGAFWSGKRRQLKGLVNG